mmetsp:Transcript_49127/g.106852  ORF Transcript_49127/g.106852 Transcript_49127/m.106852 type:complete len:208 (-) Transcript_49127:777-1400(-)
MELAVRAALKSLSWALTWSRTLPYPFARTGRQLSRLRLCLDFCQDATDAEEPETPSCEPPWVPRTAASSSVPGPRPSPAQCQGSRWTALEVLQLQPRRNWQHPRGSCLPLCSCCSTWMSCSWSPSNSSSCCESAAAFPSSSFSSSSGYCCSSSAFSSSSCSDPFAGTRCYHCPLQRPLPECPAQHVILRAEKTTVEAATALLREEES